MLTKHITKTHGFVLRIYYNPHKWLDFWFVLKIFKVLLMVGSPFSRPPKRALIDVSCTFSKEKYLNWRYGRIESNVVEDRPPRADIIEVYIGGKIYHFNSGVLTKARPRGGPKEIIPVWIGEVSGHPAVISMKDDLLETTKRLIEQRVVQPSFRYDVKLPVMGSLKVNLDENKGDI